jgi:hypothetical protein
MWRLYARHGARRADGGPGRQRNLPAKSSV